MIIFSLRFDRPDEAIKVLQSFFSIEQITAGAATVQADPTQAVGFTAEFPNKETEDDEQ